MFWEIFCIGNIITDVVVLVGALTIFLTQVHHQAGDVDKSGVLGKFWILADEKIGLKHWWAILFCVFVIGILLEIIGVLLKN